MTDQFIWHFKEKNNELIGHLRKYEEEFEPRAFLRGFPVLRELSDSLGPLTRQISSDVSGIRFRYRLKISSYPKNDKAIHEKVQRMPQSKCSAPPHHPELCPVIIFTLTQVKSVERIDM